MLRGKSIYDGQALATKEAARVGASVFQDGFPGWREPASGDLLQSG